MRLDSRSYPPTARFPSQMLAWRPSYGCVRTRTIDFQGAAVQQVQTPPQLKLIAPGVTAEVIVIVQDQNPARGASQFAKKMGRGEPTDSAAHDDQVIRFTGVGWGVGLAPVPQSVRLLK